MNEGSRRFKLTESRVHGLGLLAGPLIAVAVYVVLGGFDDLGEDGRRLAAVGTLMAVWWVSEAIPLAATALVPLVLFPALQIVGITEDPATDTVQQQEMTQPESDNGGSRGEEPDQGP